MARSSWLKNIFISNGKKIDLVFVIQSNWTKNIKTRTKYEKINFSIFDTRQIFKAQILFHAMN